MNHSKNNHASQLRRAFIERQISAAGTLQIEPTATTLGVSRAQVTADLAAVTAENPKAITYDPRAKQYRWTAGSKVRSKLPPYIAAVVVTDANGKDQTTA